MTLLLTLNIFHTFDSIVDFISWVFVWLEVSRLKIKALQFSKVVSFNLYHDTGLFLYFFFYTF